MMMDGVYVALLGMTVVFSFLLVLIGVLQLLALFERRFAGAMVTQAVTRHTHTPSRQQRAAIAAATLHHHQRSML